MSLNESVSPKGTVDPQTKLNKLVRGDFPVLKEEVQGKPLVYLDNAASSQMPQSVIDRLVRYHSHEHANVHRGVHSLSQEATDEFEASRESVRQFINAGQQKEVIFTYGTTDGMNFVSRSLGDLVLEEGSEILISEMEHHANIVPWQMVAREKGAKIRTFSVTDEGELDLDSYRRMLNERTAIVATLHVSNVLGTVNPVREIAHEAHKLNIPVVIDGAQAVPHQKVDVQELDCDFYVFSGHKMYGPTGVGVVYGKEKWLNEMRPSKGGGEMIDKVTFEETTYADLPHKFEPGTPPISQVIGLKASIDYLNSIGMDRIADMEHELLLYGTEKLSNIEGLRIIGQSKNKAAVISFVMEDIHPHDIGTILDQQGIAIRTGHHCAQPLIRRYGVPATARASMAFYNNEYDIDRLVEGMETVRELFD